MNRRNWISSTALLSSAMLLQPGRVVSQAPAKGQKTASIRLSANENPHGPSVSAQKAIATYVEEGNRYPGVLRKELVSQLAKKFNVNEGNVLLGAGSSDLLQLLAFWCINERKTLITSDLTFDIITQCVKRFDGVVLEAELTQNKKHDLVALEQLAQKNPGVVYLVNPNNPTGSKVDDQELRAFCERVSKHSYVIVDEAYIEYLEKNESMAQLVQHNDRIIVLRTFSKIFGLAGLRVGYLLGAIDLVKSIKAYQVWTGANLNGLGLAAASASLNDSTFIALSRKHNEINRSFTLNELRKLNRYCVEPYANFIWFNCGAIEASYLGNAFAEQGIIVAARQVEECTWMRITIGKKEAMEQFVEIAKTIWI